MVTRCYLRSNHEIPRRGVHLMPASPNGPNSASSAMRLLIFLFVVSIIAFPISAHAQLSVSVSDSTFVFGTMPADSLLTPQTTIIRIDGTAAETFAAKISPLTDSVNV